nr:hypothetical protein [Micromonospora sp. DSM 115978]
VYICRDDDELALLTGLEVARALDVSRPRGDPGSTVVIKIGRRQSFEEAFAPMGRSELERTSRRILDDVGVYSE